MKYLFSVIIVISILSFQFSELLVYVSFKINQDYIAKNLCVEKDIEESTCNGCCQLKKKVNEQQEQKKDLPPNQTEKQNINFCSQNCNLDLLFNEDCKELSLKTQKEYKFTISHFVFHPPR